MRLSPSAPGALWREAEDCGIIVDNEYIPKGMDVATCIYSLHHSSECYPEPFSFRPERWLLNDQSSTPYRGIVSPHAAFTPFSIGSRSCIGKGLAYVELTLTLAYILWSFDFEITEGAHGSIGGGNTKSEYGRHRVDEFQMYDHVTSAKDGPYVRFKRHIQPE
jgi:cytochrome P450